ncbi:hypothetical protein SKUL_60 [Pseudomonas phage Skulduggery]|uniref:Uncharacterized protein n=1 Tax=Pseudomonas phage Skulduggery TaxID=2006671 RepID=A0A1Y0T043_9CAUD|nr:hypothetical protein PP627_gp60 [Pseudomonas phage Skulduggery]ARV77159.1 hypothetical protein SKUL_60 [Pseudomonas phage Skulduggery]
MKTAIHFLFRAKISFIELFAIFLGLHLAASFDFSRKGWGQAATVWVIMALVGAVYRFYVRDAAHAAEQLAEMAGDTPESLLAEARQLLDEAVTESKHRGEVIAAQSKAMVDAETLIAQLRARTLQLRELLDFNRTALADARDQIEQRTVVVSGGEPASLSELMPRLGGNIDTNA